MELSEPKRKKIRANFKEQNPFPVTEIVENNVKHRGLFSGINVEIFDKDSIKSIYENGCFGKGSFSRSVPTILRPKKPITMKEQQYLHRLEMAQKFEVNAEDYEDEEFINIPSVCLGNEEESQTVKNPFVIKEALALSLEEAFFLHYSLKCLEIRDLENETLSTEDIFEKFCDIKKNFVSCFVTYQYLRSKNWVVKSGVKFGGEFLLYKRGPRFYHASFIVTVHENLSKKNETTRDLQALYRISETSGKNLLMVDVYFPKDITINNSIECLQRLSSFEVSEHVIKRFVFEHERE